MENTLLGFGSLAINGSLALAVVYFGKKWMLGVEKTAEKNRNELSEQTCATRKELAEFTAKTTADLKDAIRENRDEYRLKSTEIISSINKLADHVATANGRTTKNELAHVCLEGEVKAMIKLCAERHGHIGELT